MYRKAADLIQLADQMFALRAPVIRMWQAVADNFFPMRADFDAIAAAHSMTAPPSDWLADSLPVLCHRDLSNSVESMLRDGNWYQMSLGDGEEPDQAGKLWLSDKTNRMRAMMGVRTSGFSRAVKQGDMDYMAFGQTVISVGLRRDLRGLLYQNWHLRDCAWFDDESGQVGGFVRVWRPTRHLLLETFGYDHPQIDRKIKEGCAKEPFVREEFLHIVMPASKFQDQNDDRFPFISFWVDRNHCCIVEEVPQPNIPYVIPRFLTLAESPYGYSPAAMSALPDARTLQAMTFTLLEAAEKYTRPPIIATQGVISGVIDLSPDGITYVDKEYDEKLGASLRPLQQDKSGYPIGQHERTRVVETLRSAFYLDKINVPQKEAEMTAYEVAELMKEYRRQNLPLFLPIETEYNGQLCELTFDVLMRGRFFGSIHDIPDSLQGRDVSFKYKSPLSSAEEQTRAAKFGHIQTLVTSALELDPDMPFVVDFPAALRSSIEGLDVPPDWLRSEKQRLAMVEQRQQQVQAQQMAAMAAQAAEMGIAA